MYCQLFVPVKSSSPNVSNVQHGIRNCIAFCFALFIFLGRMNPYSPYFSLNNESRKLSYILDLRCPPETIRFCCKYIDSIHIRRERFALYVEVSFYMFMYTYMYIHMFRVNHQTLRQNLAKHIAYTISSTLFS